MEFVANKRKEKARRYREKLKAKIIQSFSCDFQSFLKLACCNIEQEICMIHNCENCVKTVKNDLVPLSSMDKTDLSSMDKTVKWQHWRQVDDRIALTYTVAPLADLIHELEVQLPSFKRHFFVKRAQQNYFEIKKKIILRQKT